MDARSNSVLMITLKHITIMAKTTGETTNGAKRMIWKTSPGNAHQPHHLMFHLRKRCVKNNRLSNPRKNTAPHSIQQVAGILVSREKPLYQNASRQIKSLPSRQLPKQQARQTKSFPLQFADKGRQRNETSFRSSMPKRSAPRQSRKALIQQVSEQPVREENCLFSIPTGSSQPRWLANQHISGQLTRKSIAVATEELTGLPVIKMRWNPIQQQTVRQPKINRSSRFQETEGEMVPTNQISREQMTESGLVAIEQLAWQPARKRCGYLFSMNP